MGEKWQRERDAQVAAQQARQTAYSAYDLQIKMVNDIKAPMMDGIAVFMNPATGYGEKLGALLKLRRAMIAFTAFPEPTVEEGPGHTWHPNSHRLIKIRDEFFKHCRLNDGRQNFMRMGINFLIVLYDYDPPYRMMIDFWAKALDVKNWDYSVPVTVVGHIWPWWIE